MARRVGARGALGRALRAAAPTIDDGQRLALLEEAVSVLEHSPARLELAHALADLGAELNRRNRRREGRETPSELRSSSPATAARFCSPKARRQSCTPDPGGVHGPS